MTEQPNEKELDIAGTDAKETQKTDNKRKNYLNIAAWGIIVFGAIVFAGVAYGILGSGQLTIFWNNMTEAQGAVLAALITVYAAAIAGVVGPAILGAKFNDLDEQVAKLTTKMNTAADDVDDLTQSTKSSLHTLTELLQRNAGISPTYTTDDLAKKDEILKAMQSQAANFAQMALENSNKWGSTKSKFRGKWPSRQNYIELLWQHDVITDMDYDLFTRIVKSRDLIGEDKPIDVVILNDLQSALDKLGKKYDYS